MADTNPLVTVEETSDDISETKFQSIPVERTLAIVKPDALSKADEIEDIILRSGFTVHQVFLRFKTLVLVTEIFCFF